MSEQLLNDSETPLEQIISNRTEKVKKLKEAGINPYPSSFKTTGIKWVIEKYSPLNTGDSSEEKFSVAGRLTTRRKMGKAVFADLVDKDAKVQIYVRSNIVGPEEFNRFIELIDMGDFIGVYGSPFRTKTGELSVMVENLSLLSKALRPLPEKWHGIKDTEIKYRQRYLDLISNEDTKKLFTKRSVIISSIRKTLSESEFLEVETPMMQTIAGGAAARPFKTHHNALDLDLNLRIAPELYLKRLVVGGMERVFEIGRNFRNEGIDRQHNPEFTMLEIYKAYSDYSDMMLLCEEIIKNAAALSGKALKFPFKRAGLFDLLKEHTGYDLLPMIEKQELRDLAKKLNVDVPKDASIKKVFDHIFDKMVLPNLTEPTFVLDYPSVYSPLAKPKAQNSALSERFELYINGWEIANAYSELNDPQIQRIRFEEQMKERAHGDEEAQLYDEDYVTALEHGLPPTGGLGIGVDRLVMVLTDTDSIRDVILFPLMRP